MPEQTFSISSKVALTGTISVIASRNLWLPLKSDYKYSEPKEATNGQTLPGITTWQYTPRCPTRMGYLNTFIMDSLGRSGVTRHLCKTFLHPVLKVWAERPYLHMTLPRFQPIPARYRKPDMDSTKLFSKRWATEITSRDQLFLDKLVQHCLNNNE